MPPDGYTAVTISDEVAEKLTQIMTEHGCQSYGEPIESAVDTTLVQEEEITVQQLIQMLAKRADELE
ncbi:hypothetical protein D8Y22_12390 [Salinadaptatus halalkaliphilus]|uniref:Uncharacterized protein n=1 Tax=Salinadaptatus halalkaliphilus TaxID=2419781 RepID=A0A4V3VL64_9EURY|nr:hypothetical protein D8Y22_12390 [Salinadaptatus halalkaliphilus]